MRKTVAMRTPTGMLLEADEDAQFVMDEIWTRHVYDRDIPIASGMSVVDVGAHQGFFSVYAASKGAMVASFEPEPHNFALLQQNIVSNHLEERVRARPLAMTQRDGHCVLYVPEEDVENGSALVTRSRNLNRPAVQGRARRKRLPCISLASALTQAGLTRVDLLKLDCEGAELDILKGAPADVLSRVRNIVMETHRTYSEKAMVSLLRSHGFHIVRLEKMAGPFASGFIAASRTPPAAACPPAASLSAPECAAVHEPVTLDAGESFSVSGGKRRLHYAWKIDGVDSDASGRRCTVSFAEPGAHEVVLQVCDGELSDSARRWVWVVAPGSAREQAAMSLPRATAGIEVKVCGTQHYTIPKELFPARWTPTCIVVQIVTHTRPLHAQRPPVRLRFNGVERSLVGNCVEIRAPHYPMALDLSFTLITSEPRDLRMSWWLEGDLATSSPFEAPSGSPLEAAHDAHADGVVLATEPGVKVELVVEGRQVLQLPQGWRPRWNPTALVIGVAQPTILGPWGTLTVANRSWQLSDGWTEARLPIAELSDPVQFALAANAPLQVGITWWCE